MEGLEKVIIGDLEMQRRTGRSSVVSNHAPYHHGRFSDVFKCVRILLDVHMYVCSLAEDALRVQLSLCCKRLGRVGFSERNYAVSQRLNTKVYSN